ncbi:MAG: type 4a pilus biogenesis protein PilO [Gaiellaceae bacterium MAG52_C11]|nr:type 4a pilus biogenesis protein PilO [Candidatus Gaiellasilicea maunaloa]
MIERLNSRRAFAVGAGGILLVLLVGWFGIVSPQRSKAADLSVKIEEAETQLVVAQSLVRGALPSESKAELATLRKAIPDEVEMSGILRQLSGASAATRVRITAITPQPAVSVGAADVVAMTVGVEGRYFGIRNFLRSLRDGADIRRDKVKGSGRLFAVDSIQFAGGDTTGNVKATLSVAAFVFRGTVPAAGAPTAPLDAPLAEAAGR